MFEQIKPEYYKLTNFKFESGERIASLQVEYSTLGVPFKDDQGYITNAIVYVHGWSGDFSSVERLKDLTGPGKPLDINKYFIISPTALGSPGSASPSTTNLGADFPQYNIRDMVNFLQTFIKEKFPIKHLKGIIGNSMGGFQALTWAVLYPDDMDFIIPLVSSYQSKGWNFALFYYMNSLIENDPEYLGGAYTKNPSRITAAASQFMYLFGFSRDHYQNSDNHEIADSMAIMGEEGSLRDANDIVWRNRAAMAYNIKNVVNKIQAKTLIIAIKEDLYFPPEYDALPLSEAIPGADLLIYSSKWGHVGSQEIIKIEQELAQFLNKI